LFQETKQLTSFSYKNCRVSDVMGMPNRGYGFNILNERAQPVLSLRFEGRDNAEQARVEVAKAVTKAVEVTRHALQRGVSPNPFL
jgi:hypothetical protein